MSFDFFNKYLLLLCYFKEEINILRKFYVKQCTIRQDSKETLLDGFGKSAFWNHIFNRLINNIKNSSSKFNLKLSLY